MLQKSSQSSLGDLKLSNQHCLTIRAEIPLSTTYLPIRESLCGNHLLPVFRAIVLACLIPASQLAHGQQPMGQFIWSVPNARSEVPAATVYFRKTFTTGPVKSGQLEITCDDGYRVYLNGRLVGSDTVWQEVIRYDVTPLLREGQNVIAIQAENASPSPAGLYCKLTLTTADQTRNVVTDQTWKFSAEAPARWRLPDFDASDWKAAHQQGLFGETPPWGNQFRYRDQTVAAAERTRTRLERKQGELVTGDRVVFLGGTFVERLQTHNYLESLLTSQFPQLELTFRNLGWSGDNVFGLSRAVFGNQEDGFQRLEKDLALADPTLVIVNYGQNESFRGPEYLPEFRSGLERLAELIESQQADLFFVSPMLLENLGPPLPDPTPQNENIRLYADAIREFAESRGYVYIDYLRPLGESAVTESGMPWIRHQLTSNGMHLTPYGYWRSAPRLLEKLGGELRGCQFDLDLAEQSFTCRGSTIATIEFQNDHVKFSARDDRLVHAPPPADVPRGGEIMTVHDEFRIRGLPPGKYGLEIDGQPSILASHEQWAAGVLINRGKYLSQPEELRAAIHRKNELFFHRHRPQNETYLYLFRKHEQGNNAVEIPQFDPLIKDLEKQIQELKVPRTTAYQLHRVGPIDP